MTGFGSFSKGVKGYSSGLVYRLAFAVFKSVTSFPPRCYLLTVEALNLEDEPLEPTSIEVCVLFELPGLVDLGVLCELNAFNQRCGQSRGSRCD